MDKLGNRVPCVGVIRISVLLLRPVVPLVSRGCRGCPVHVSSCFFVHFSMFSIFHVLLFFMCFFFPLP